MTFEVRSREVYAAERVVYNPFQDSGSTTASGSTLRSPWWTADHPSFGHQAAVRARDAVGNVGPWSYSGATTLPADDAYPLVRRSGTWSRAGDTSSYNAGFLRTSARGATVSLLGRGHVVAVIGVRCPTCGQVEVTVDGGRRVVVDTRSSRVVRRSVLAKYTVSYGDHEVRLRNLATRGRPYAIVDGFAFTP